IREFLFVFRHRDKFEIRNFLTREFVKTVLDECLRELPRRIFAKIEKYHRVPFFYPCFILSVPCRLNELVSNSRPILFLKIGDGAIKFLSFAFREEVICFFNLLPILIPIHREIPSYYRADAREGI